jgi:hypothetical protein
MGRAVDEVADIHSTMGKRMPDLKRTGASKRRCKALE